MYMIAIISKATYTIVFRYNTLRSFLAIEKRLREFSELNTDY